MNHGMRKKFLSILNYRSADNEVPDYPSSLLARALAIIVPIQSLSSQ